MEASSCPYHPPLDDLGCSLREAQHNRGLPRLVRSRTGSPTIPAAPSTTWCAPMPSRRFGEAHRGGRGGGLRGHRPHLRGGRDDGGTSE